MKAVVALCAMALFLGSAFAEANCPDACPDLYAPLCGSDAHTYNSECELARARCSSSVMSSLVAVHEGECTADDRDFLCDIACDKHYAPVCGDDGQTYSNPCMLEVASCRARRVISMVYPGECDSAPKVPEDGDKEADACNEMCTMEYEPVCANDGKTYSNACQLRSIACRLKIDLKAVHRGACRSSTTACSAKPCAEDEQCIDEPKECFKEPCEQFRCVKLVDVLCDRFCIDSYQPVCGSNGKIYSNLCELEAEDCRARAADMNGIKSQRPRACACLCNSDALARPWSDLVAAAGTTKLNKDAFAKALKGVPQWEVESMFDHADENEDGVITAEEFEALQKKQSGASDDDNTIHNAQDDAGAAAPLSLYAILGIAVAGVAITVIVATVVAMSVRKVRANKQTHQRLLDDAYAETQYREVPVEDDLERSF